MALDLYVTGDNSGYITISGGESLTNILSYLGNILYSKGWLLVDEANLIFRSRNVDQLTYKYVQLVYMKDPNDANNYIGSLVPKTGLSSELTVPQNSSAFGKINWFKLTSSSTFNLWFFANSRWLLLTSQQGSTIGRGITDTFRKDTASAIGDWYSNSPWYNGWSGFSYGNAWDGTAQNGNGDYLDSDNYDNYYTGYAREGLHWVYSWFPYFDPINDSRFYLEYLDYRNIQGCIEVTRGMEGDTPYLDYPPYIWTGTAFMLDNDSTILEDGDYYNERRAVARRVSEQHSGISRPINSAGYYPKIKSPTGSESNSLAYICGLQEFPNLYHNKNYSVVKSKSVWNGKNHITEIGISDKYGYRGKCYGIKLCQSNEAIPFGTTVKLKVDDNFMLSANGTLKEFIYVPGYVHKRVRELRRYWTFWNSSRSRKSIPKSSLPHLPNVATSSLYTYGYWSYYYQYHNLYNHSSYLIPA